MRKIAFQATTARGMKVWDGWTERAIQKAAAAAGIPLIVRQKTALPIWLGQGLRRVGLVRNLRTLERHAYLVTIPHLCEYKLVPATYFAEIVPYVYDCWPGRWDEWEHFFRRHDIRVAFFSAKATRDHFAQRLSHIDCVWMAEGCDPSLYDPSRSLRERGSDVDMFGRKYEPFHKQILQPLVDASIRYKYQHSPDRDEFIRELADCRISICFPRSVTDPAFAGGVETVTLRYLECMASGCLIFGKCPAELIELYGYDPVIAADADQPGAQLIEIARNIEQYQTLADRNLARTREIGSWDARLRSIRDVLLSRGYSI